jgi:hypothetical protein
MKKKQKIKTNPIPPGVLSAFPHLGVDLSIGSARFEKTSIKENIKRKELTKGNASTGSA